MFVQSVVALKKFGPPTPENYTGVSWVYQSRRGVECIRILERITKNTGAKYSTYFQLQVVIGWKNSKIVPIFV
jgi:hypothetical protein